MPASIRVFNESITGNLIPHHPCSSTAALLGLWLLWLSWRCAKYRQWQTHRVVELSTYYIVVYVCPKQCWTVRLARKEWWIVVVSCIAFLLYKYETINCSVNAYFDRSINAQLPELYCAYLSTVRYTYLLLHPVQWQCMSSRVDR